jgi:hypothetical protein
MLPKLPSPMREFRRDAVALDMARVVFDTVCLHLRIRWPLVNDSHVLTQ